MYTNLKVLCTLQVYYKFICQSYHNKAEKTDSVYKRGVEEYFLINPSLEGYSTVCLCLPNTILKQDFDA